MEKQAFVEDTDEGDEGGWVSRCVIIYTLIATMLTSGVTHCVIWCLLKPISALWYLIKKLCQMNELH